MKKSLLVVAAVLTLVAVLGVTGYAFAQTPTPEAPFGGGIMGGFGHMAAGMMGAGHMTGGHMTGGHMSGGHMAGGMMGAGHMTGSHGPMHEYMLRALAEKLDLTTEELQARLDSGKSMWDVALAQGLTEGEVTALMTEAHTQALEAAVAAGAITSEQAEWMNSHMQQMHGDGASGGCHGGAPKNTAPTGSEL